MTTRSITNAQLINFRNALRPVTCSNGLASVKLHRVRDVLEREAAPACKAWSEIDERHALRENDTPVVQKKDDEPLTWLATGTLAYAPDPAKDDARAAELEAFAKGEHTIETPSFTDDDLAWMQNAERAGEALAFFAA